MGNTSSERAGMGHEKAHRRDSRGTKEGDRPKILMDSPEDADIFHGEDIKVCVLARIICSFMKNLMIMCSVLSFRHR